MNETLQRIIESRPDLSDYVFHFTKGQNAKHVLEKIIQMREIKDVNETGRICFTEAPLLMLNDMFKIFDSYKNPMYARYGVAVNKRHLYELGGRPVIYGSKNEGLNLPKEMKWRFEELDLSTHDYSWLREWRINFDSFELKSQHCFMVVKTKAELELLVADWESPGEIEFDGCVSEGVFAGNAYFNVERDFKGVSFEQLKELDSYSGEELKKILSAQTLGENIGMRNLGGYIFPFE